MLDTSPSNPETAIRTEKVAIVGAGFSGLYAAIEFKEAGFRDVTIDEAEETIDGTRRDNTHPGFGCDIPSHLYSYSLHARAGRQLRVLVVGDPASQRDRLSIHVVR